MKTFTSNLFSKVFVILLLVMASSFCFADEKNNQVFGKYTVYYSTFNSLFIAADTAKSLDLTRGKDQTMINISVQETSTGNPVSAEIEATAKNLIQQTKSIKFKKIKEQGAVYYIGSVRHIDQEIFHLTFNIHVEGEPSPFTLKLTKKFYTDSEK